MELTLKIALVCIGGLFWFQCISCEGPLEGSNTSNWKCICAGPLGALNYSPASNCSSSCNCIPDESGGPDGGGWNCSCASDGTSQASGDIHDPGCFTSCNCTAGSNMLKKVGSRQKCVSH